MQAFTHMDKNGQVRMVDVTDKEPTLRIAVAQGTVFMASATFDKIEQHAVQKGNVLETARIAGVMAAKKTAELIPMCHPLKITHAKIDFVPDPAASSITIQASIHALDRTGVEMEALTAVSVAALTIYDMCKSYDRAMTVSDIRLIKKSGGKSGTYVRTTGQDAGECV